MNVANAVKALDWGAVAQQLDVEGYAVVPPFLTAELCADIAARYSGEETAFRTTVNMARHNFGRGEYKYFHYPLPQEVQALRAAFYAPLSRIANDWAQQLNLQTTWPRSLDAFTKRCHQQGQCRATPLLLRYGVGDYNCLHQDLYGSMYFPLQVVVLLSAVGRDFEGGELMLVEQRPRMQSRAMVVPLEQGGAAIIPVRERPRQGKLRVHRVQMRHGVGQVRRGKRLTLGLIFHDAA